ncbi:unnamed protein product [Clonostachys rosea f. rosea IK726]|uniref:Alpha/beta hydrolase fold-3 domain-containing protein n=2 Tax=Bionectria ochroleuca TaxID=29856 RepID=A0A0B7K1W5_BIOOC|nr:unnamed protein product [Clonostachys rosea f. rosea IK726]
MAVYLDSWHKFEESMGGARPVLKGTAEEMRNQFSGLISFLATQRTRTWNDLTVKDESINGIAIRIYIPNSFEGEHAPVGVFYHSGGFVVGDLDSEDDFCRTISADANIAVISVDYRLSPEHKAPAQLEDALAIFEWIYKNAKKIGVCSSRMFTIGTSAGGALALAVTRKIVLGQSTVPTATVKGIFALCPLVVHPSNVPTEYKTLYTSFEKHKEGVPIIDKECLLEMYNCAGLQPNDQNYYPVLDPESLKRFPPTHIFTCENDPLRDDGKILSSALSASGVAVDTKHFDGLPHCFWIIPSLPESDLFLQNLIQRVKEAVKGVSLSIN